MQPAGSGVRHWRVGQNAEAEIVERIEAVDPALAVDIEHHGADRLAGWHADPRIGPAGPPVADLSLINRGVVKPVLRERVLVRVAWKNEPSARGVCERGIAP